MDNHFYNNPGPSKSAGRSRGTGTASNAFSLRYHVNAAVFASSAMINNGFSEGSKNGFPMEYSNGTPYVPASVNNHWFPHEHAIITPMLCGITDSVADFSNIVSTKNSSEFANNNASDEGDTEVGSSDVAEIMKQRELFRSFEEFNAKVQNANVSINRDEITKSLKSNSKIRDTFQNNKDEIYQMKAAHFRKRKFSVNNAPFYIEPEVKNVEQQTDAIQQRNVSLQTLPNYCKEELNIKSDNSSSELDAKQSKTCGCQLSDSDKRHAAVESMRLPIGKIDLKGVAGLTDVKIVIRETFLLPLTHPQLFHLFHGTVKRCCRCLLYGPPGTGKTLLAQAIASELGAGLYYVSCAGILSSFIGESEKNVKDLFEHALEQDEPSIIFFDEIDSVCRKRTEGESEHSRRLKTELLKYLENPAMEESQVYVLSATNCPWDLDPAFLRRFQRHIYIPLPDRAARQQIIAQQLGVLRVLINEEGWNQILNHTEGFSGSDLANFVSMAVAQPNREILRATYWIYLDGEHVIPCDERVPNAFHAVLDDVPPEKVMARFVELNDFLYAAQETPRTVTNEHIQQFENFKRHFSR